MDISVVVSSEMSRELVEMTRESSELPQTRGNTRVNQL